MKMFDMDKWIDGFINEMDQKIKEEIKTSRKEVKDKKYIYYSYSYNGEEGTDICLHENFKPLMDYENKRFHYKLNEFNSAEELAELLGIEVELAEEYLSELN